MTVDEWLSELQLINKNSLDGAFSTEDLAERIGKSTSTVRKLMKKSIKQGQIYYAGSRLQETIHGVQKPVPVYKVVE